MDGEPSQTLSRQGQLRPEGTVAPRRAATGAPQGRSPGGRVSPGRWLAEYLRDVRGELGRVLWPKRAEVVNYSWVVFTTLVLIALLIFGLNYLFARGVHFLFAS